MAAVVGYTEDVHNAERVVLNGEGVILDDQVLQSINMNRKVMKKACMASPSSRRYRRFPSGS